MDAKPWTDEEVEAIDRNGAKVGIADDATNAFVFRALKTIGRMRDERDSLRTRLAACEEALRKIDAIAGPSEHADFDTGPTYKHLFRECKNIARAALKEPSRGN